MQRMKKAALVLSFALALQLSAQTHEWRDTFESRLEIQALLQELNGEILASSSATRTLEQWCGEHHMAPEAKITATLLRDVQKAPSAEQLQRLDVRDASQLRYRRVELRCGAHVLSVADNWYVPSRLTAEMNTALETSDTPFGKAVQSLHPYRRTIAATMLWAPLPHGWEMQRHPRSQSRRALAIPHDVFQHCAVLYTDANVPFSEVVETYQSELLAFEPVH